MFERLLILTFCYLESHHSRFLIYFVSLQIAEATVCWTIHCLPWFKLCGIAIRLHGWKCTVSCGVYDYAELWFRLIHFELSHNDRYSVYEVQTKNKFPLSPKEGLREAPKLQYVVWAPNPAKQLTNGDANKATSQGIAFVFENDLYYKPRVQNDLVLRITSTGAEILLVQFDGMELNLTKYVYYYRNTGNHIQWNTQLVLCKHTRIEKWNHSVFSGWRIFILHGVQRQPSRRIQVSLKFFPARWWHNLNLKFLPHAGTHF